MKRYNRKRMTQILTLILLCFFVINPFVGVRAEEETAGMEAYSEEIYHETASDVVSEIISEDMTVDEENAGEEAAVEDAAFEEAADGDESSEGASAEEDVAAQTEDTDIIDADDNAAEAYSEEAYSANGKVVVIQPGHSIGEDPGAVNKVTGVTEAQVNEKLACALAEKLDEAGYTVYLTHCSDNRYAKYRLGTQEEGSRLASVARLCNSVNPDLAISIHHNSGSTTASGYEIYWSSYRDFDTQGVYEVNGLWADGSSAFRDSSPCTAAKNSKTFAGVVKNAFGGAKLTYRKTVERDDYLPSHAKCACILYEGGFISNNSESRYLNSPAYIEDASDRFLNAVNDYFGVGLEYKRVYRLYNPSTSEHLYTTDKNEYETLYRKHGWGQEGIAWKAPRTGTPVYRLYQPGLDNHLYTTDQNEIKVLTSRYGWKKDNGGQPVFYSGGSTPIYRVYNAGLRGLHHLTTDLNEYNTLPKYGWAKEGQKLSGLGVGSTFNKTDYYK